MTRCSDVDDLLTPVSIFGNLKSSLRARLTQDSRQLYVGKHEFAFRRGDMPNGFYIVIKGSMKSAIPATGGREKVIEFFGAGEAFGETAMFLERPYLVDAQALEDTLLIWIDKRDLHAALERDPDLSRCMLSRLSQRLRGLVEDIEAINLQSAAQRLTTFLLKQPRDGDRTRFPYSKSIVASKLGLSPETLSRLLHQMSSEGLISVRGRQVTIHEPEALLVLHAA